MCKCWSGCFCKTDCFSTVQAEICFYNFSISVPTPQTTTDAAVYGGTKTVAMNPLWGAFPAHLQNTGYVWCVRASIALVYIPTIGMHSLQTVPWTWVAECKQKSIDRKIDKEINWPLLWGVGGFIADHDMIEEGTVRRVSITGHEIIVRCCCCVGKNTTTDAGRVLCVANNAIPNAKGKCLGDYERHNGGT